MDPITLLVIVVIILIIMQFVGGWSGRFTPRDLIPVILLIILIWVLLSLVKGI